MDSSPDSPDLHAALAAAQAEITRLSSDLGRVEQERDKAVAQRDDHRTEIDRLTLEIKLLRHRLFSSGSERDRRHLDQLELKLEEA
jgi:chromosome segregation ATPase